MTELTHCQKKALRQTVIESVLWTFGIAAGVGIVILIVWGVVMVGEYLSNVFPLISFIAQWGFTIAALGFLLFLLAALILGVIKHRYDELKKHCEWVEHELKKGG